MSEAPADPRVVRGMAAQLALRARRTDAGARVIGWKVGFGAPAAMEKLGIRAPLTGFLTDHALLDPGASVSLAGWVKPAAEAEIAVYLGADVPGHASRDAARMAIAALGPAIELADVDSAPDDVERILAGNIYQRHVMLGERDASRAGSRLGGLTARIVRNGSEIASTTDLQALTGNHVDIVRHVADALAALGEQLTAGQFVITGSITPPLWMAAGESLRFDLDPIGSLAVRFTA